MTAEHLKKQPALYLYLLQLPRHIVQALIQAFQHGHITITLLRRNRMERADTPVRQARITADFRLPQIAALETVDEQRDGRRFGRTLGGTEVQAALTVQLIRHSRRQPVGQRRGPQVVLRHLHRVAAIS